MMIVSLPLAFLVIRSIKETNYEDEQVSLFAFVSWQMCLLPQTAFVEDLKVNSVEMASKEGTNLQAERLEESSKSRSESK